MFAHPPAPRQVPPRGALFFSMPMGSGSRSAHVGGLSGARSGVRAIGRRCAPFRRPAAARGGRGPRGTSAPRRGRRTSGAPGGRPCRSSGRGKSRRPCRPCVGACAPRRRACPRRSPDQPAGAPAPPRSRVDRGDLDQAPAHHGLGPGKGGQPRTLVARSARAERLPRRAPDGRGWWRRRVRKAPPAPRRARSQSDARIVRCPHTPSAQGGVQASVTLPDASSVRPGSANRA